MDKCIQLVEDFILFLSYANKCYKMGEKCKCNQESGLNSKKQKVFKLINKKSTFYIIVIQEGFHISP